MINWKSALGTYTRDELLAKLAGLRLAPIDQKRAPHKPLLLSLAIAFFTYSSPAQCALSSSSTRMYLARRVAEMLIPALSNIARGISAIRLPRWV